MRVDYGVGRSRGVEGGPRCIVLAASGQTFHRPSHPLSRARARARSFALLSVALSRPLCPFVLSSPRLSVLIPCPPPPLPRPIIIAVSLSLSSFDSSVLSNGHVKLKSCELYEPFRAGIQPSMRGRVVPSCREHAVPSCTRAKMCACAAFIPLSLIRPSLSVARRLLLMAQVVASYSLFTRPLDR